MKCKDCGAEVANIGELNRHRANCVAYAKRVEFGAASANGEGARTNPVIPWERVDPSLKVLSKGTPMTFRILGVVTEGGIEVKEVHPDRR